MTVELFLKSKHIIVGPTIVIQGTDANDGLINK